MPTPSPRQLLRRHAVAFSTSFVSLTVVLVANYAAKRLPELTPSGAGATTAVAALSFVWNSQIVPRANERLAAMSARGAVLQISASCAVFSAYYACLVAGESLADWLLLSPFVAMWMANAVFLAFALLVVWRQSRSPGAPHPAEPLTIGG